MLATSKAMSNVASMGTVFPLAVAIHREGFTAILAGDDVVGLVLYQVQVGVPPGVPAGRAAESFPLASRVLCNGFAAVLADRAIWLRRHTVSPTKRFNCIDGNADFLGNMSISDAIPAQVDDLLFLFCSHKI